MESRSSAILGTLVGVSKTYGKKYCYPSQKTILRLLAKYHGFEFSRRTLNRDLKELEVNGFIKRLRRLTEKGIHAGRFSSTLYKFTHKAFKYLFGLGKWVEGVFSSFRVPKVAHNKSQRENEIFSGFPASVENLWKSPREGSASHSQGIL
jgi:phosphoglycolate phosphatase-like HAD superfamily hydrolase